MFKRTNWSVGVVGAVVMAGLCWMPTLSVGQTAEQEVSVSKLAQPPRPPVVTLAKFAQAPTVDGKLDQGEWDRAAQLAGFMAEGFSPWSNTKGRFFLDPRRGTTYIGFTADRLYIAMITELPPDRVPIANHENDEVVNIVGDDSIELWFCNPRRMEDQYQFMGNWKGSIFDIIHAHAGSDQSWNPKWEFANVLDEENNVWISEISVPFSAFGFEGDPTGQTFKMLLARNFKRPWSQDTVTPGGNSFRTPDGYTTFRLTENDPVVRMTGIGEYGNGTFGPLYDKAHLKLQLQVVNPGPARQVQIALAAQSTDMPGREETKTIDLPADGSADYLFELSPGIYHDTASHMVNFKVQAADDQTPIMSTGFLWTKAQDGGWQQVRETPWQVITGPQPEQVTGLTYYPSYNLLRVYVNTRMLGVDYKGQPRGHVTVADKAGKVVLDKDLAWEGVEYTELFEIPELPEGEYAATFTIDGFAEPMVDTFRRKHFAWEGNTLGITDEVIPPFTPITVAPGSQDVGVVLRKYKLSGLGLLDSVQAKGQDADEDFEELLAGPIALVADGEQVLEGKGKFISKADNKVVYEGSAEHPAVSVKLRNTIEEDGCMKVELTLAPAPGNKQQELKSLSLEIPLKDKMVPLYHVSSTTLRTNPAGATPTGQGVVWTNNDYPTGVWHKSFHPYIWLGAEARGLCWFADNDKGWILDINEKQPEKAVPPQELIRKGDTLTLKINLVQKPVVLDKEHKIVFGLMASPAKPMPEDWRAYGRSDGKTVGFSMGQMFGTGASYSSKYPLSRDWGTFDFVQAGRRGQTADAQAFASEWVERAAHPDMPEKMKEHFRSIVAKGIARGNGIADKGWSVYFDEFHSTSIFLEEASYYQGEWSGRQQADELPRYHTEMGDRMRSFSTSGIVPSYRDFAAYYGAEWIKRGFGLYFDNAMPRPHWDPITSSAYELPNGKIQPSAGMWARREYLRRIWTLHRQLSPADTPAVMMIHITNTHIVPYMVWNDVNLDLEWKRSDEPIQSKFTPELLRAETIGLQTGNIPTSFDTAAKDRNAKAISELALLVHEAKIGLGTKPYPDAINAFGYGLPDCKVVNYWDENPPIKVSDDQCKWLLLERDGKKMVVLATWNREPSQVTLRFDATPAGAADAKTGEALTVRDGAVVVPMDAYGARIVQIQ